MICDEFFTEQDPQDRRALGAALVVFLHSYALRFLRSGRRFFLFAEPSEDLQDSARIGRTANPSLLSTPLVRFSNRRYVLAYLIF
jgi:hypothetical protein